MLTDPAASAGTTTEAARPGASGTSADADAGLPGGRRWGPLLVAAWVVQVVVRLAFASGQSMPVATPDETGYLFAARVLAGGPPADMSYGTVYRGGYPMLLAPVFALVHDPETVYRLCLAVNALVGALVLPLGYVLLRRFGLTRGRALLFANVVALLPATVFYSEFVLTDAILPAVVLGWLLLAHTWFTSASPRVQAASAVGASLLAGYACVTHSRGAVIIAVHAVLLLVAAVRRWRPFWQTALAAAALGALFLAGTKLNDHLFQVLYPMGDNDLEGNLRRRLTTSDGLGWTFSLAVGQLWYLIIGTGGLAGVGLLGCGSLAFRRGTEARLRMVALAVLASIAGIALATSAALPDEIRVGNYVYGRYLACFTPLLVGAGIAVLVRASRRTLALAAAGTVALAAASGAAVFLYAGDRLTKYVFTPFDFPESSFLTMDWQRFHLWRATAAGLALLGLAVLVVWALRGRKAMIVLAGALAVVEVGMTGTATAEISRPLVRRFTPITDLDGLAAPHDRVAVDWQVPWKLRLPMLYNVWWHKNVEFDGNRRRPPASRADLIILNWRKGVPPERTWRHGKPPQGWHIVGTRTSPEGGWVAWRHS
ncbi:phospholipid carrier-dependent glycosyltransferase [Actinomadura harenae]|uniref:Phospholipid carrier-dependent glycosyltransferase n=1 Tax=Actinomadura harenae TaxID=2483351 RepID=A0A3M2LSQ4_9ACTN|nr:phospholipid carrier-dependent glycosyltransferase [Actinomadura harenae]RMI40282.1 phospholipid carrier-dependent glycosyltransferase [Actinomadura harenae]